MGHFSGYFEGALTFLTPKLSLAALWTIFRGSKKSLIKFNNLSLITTMPAIFFASVIYTGEQLIAVVNNTSNKT
jgi:hypothetical protein